jgi:hypothetical protein
MGISRFSSSPLLASLRGLFSLRLGDLALYFPDARSCAAASASSFLTTMRVHVRLCAAASASLRLGVFALTSPEGFHQSFE